MTQSSSDNVDVANRRNIQKNRATVCFANPVMQTAAVHCTRFNHKYAKNMTSFICVSIHTFKRLFSKNVSFEIDISLRQSFVGHLNDQRLSHRIMITPHDGQASSS
jgi:hypothetical protein